MRRSRLETVRRVAELRENAARAGVALAQQRCDEAAQVRLARLAELERTGVSAGPVGLAVAEAARRERLASCVTDAGHAVAARELDRREAVSTWAGAARKAQLLDDVCTRHRDEAATAAESSTQRFLDDLAGNRRAV